MMLFMIYQFKTLKTEHDCWPDNGWSMTNIEPGMLKEYIKLYLPKIFAISSAFWRVAAIGAVCATLGKFQLGVFNMSYRVLWITLTFIGSVASAGGIKISQALGAGDGELARKRTMTVMKLISVLLIILSSIVLMFTRRFG